MNPNHEPQLESAVQRALKALPELTAPPSVADRVMTAIAGRERAPWHRRPWAAWPPALRAASLALMLTVFIGLCFAGRELAQTQAIARSAQAAGQWISGLNCVRNLGDILAESALLVVKKMGAPWIVAGSVAAALVYAFFLGLGTVCFRLAFPKPASSRL